MTYAFGPFQLDARSRRLRRGDEVMTIAERHFDVLLQLVSQQGQIVAKDALIAAAWGDVAVTDNSLEQAISSIRRTLGAPPAGPPTYIETLARRGYRFAVPVSAAPSRYSDDALAAMLAPYQVLVDGRAALETLDRDAVTRACSAFEEITQRAPDYAPGHLGLANALALALESVRAESGRDLAMLQRALQHASEACRLDPAAGEAWATLSVLCHQSRDHARAIAAARRAAALEPDNWRHHLRLAYVSWGEVRLRAAQRVMQLLPDFPFAHWLAATVHVARQAFTEAEQELRAGAQAQDRQPAEAPFKGVGSHLLLGLLQLANGDEPGATSQFERELAHEPSRHIYGREACANTWCGVAAIHLRRHRLGDATEAFQHALDGVPGHATALAGLAALSPRSDHAAQRLRDRLSELRADGAGVEAAVAEAVHDTLAGEPQRAARIVQFALESAPPGSAGWLVPVEPLLHPAAHSELWAPVLTLIRSRAL